MYESAGKKARIGSLFLTEWQIDIWWGELFRLIVVIKFTIKFIYIRFIAIYTEYEK